MSDRATALKFWAMRLRQVCWAHLVRKFVSYSEREGPAGKLGKELPEYTSLMFEYWARLQQGHLSRKTFVERMVPVRREVEALLERAVSADVAGVSGSCADILEHREALWTFVDREGVEPTNYQRSHSSLADSPGGLGPGLPLATREAEGGRGPVASLHRPRAE